MTRDLLAALKFFVIISCICIIFAAAVVFAAEEIQKPPFTGKAKTDNVNIRAGGNENFEILAKLNSDDFVSVVDESYSWYKVILPKTASCYVRADFIEKIGTTSTAKVSRVNLRARPNTEASIIGQLAKGDSVTISSEEKDGWYQIEPPLNCYGWVRADLLEKSAISKEMPAEKFKPPTKQELQPAAKPAKKRRFLWW